MGIGRVMGGGAVNTFREGADERFTLMLALI